MKKSIKGFLCAHFLLLSSVLSVVISLLYSIKGIQTEFKTGTWFIIGANLAYPLIAFFIKEKSVPYYLVCYMVLLVFLTAFEKTFLFNNFSAFLIMIIAAMIKPKFEVPGILLYLMVVILAFVLNEESLLLFLIHLSRTLWFSIAFIYAMSLRFGHSDLVLYDDEKKILDQLLDGKMYQKEVEGFSENTVYRKLKAARERNNCATREELIELYRKTR